MRLCGGAPLLGSGGPLPRAGPHPGAWSPAHHRLHARSPLAWNAHAARGVCNKIPFMRRLAWHRSVWPQPAVAALRLLACQLHQSAGMLACAWCTLPQPDPPIFRELVHMQYQGRCADRTNLTLELELREGKPASLAGEEVTNGAGAHAPEE